MPRWIATVPWPWYWPRWGRVVATPPEEVRSPSSQTSKSGQSSKSGQGLTFVGFDSNPMLVEALGQGKLQGLVLQNPYQMGDLGVRSAVAHLEDAEVTSRIGTGEKLATPENISDPALVELLNPPKATSSTDAEVPKEKTKQWRLLVIPKSTANEFWQTVHAGAIKAAEELGNVEIIWKGPEKEDDYTKQIDLIENAKALGVDGIVLAPVDAKVLVSPVERVIDQEIPVVIIDSALESKRTVSFVATDNYHGGVLAAKRMAVVLGDKGNVIVLRHMVGSESTEQREQGLPGDDREISGNQGPFAEQVCRGHRRDGEADGEDLDQGLQGPGERNLLLERAEHDGDAQRPGRGRHAQARGSGRRRPSGWHEEGPLMRPPRRRGSGRSGPDPEY